MKRHIPNMLTLMNLFCALPALDAASRADFHTTLFWMILSLAFDFLDGLVARWLDVATPLGVQLDSLADVVSFGVVPSMVLFKIAVTYVPPELQLLEIVPYLSFIVAAGAAFRLARFNLDVDQTKDFKGLPTPSCAILVIGIPFIIEVVGREVLQLYHFVIIPFLLIWFMNADFRLFSLKLSHADSFLWLKGVFVLAAVVILVWFKKAGLSAVVLLYILLSILFYHPTKSIHHEIQS